MHQGTVSKWNDAKGFGFIQTDDGQQLFFHISSVQGGRRPRLNERVSYHLGQDAQGRPRATQVQLSTTATQSAGHRHNAKPFKQWLFIALLLLCAALLFKGPLLQWLGHDALGTAPSSQSYSPELAKTLALIKQGGPYPYKQDGTVFQNRERQLPQKPRGYYREYTVRSPELNHRGPLRVVTGGHPPEIYYYTSDHYRSFRQIEAP